jgi:hypothetical protein
MTPDTSDLHSSLLNELNARHLLVAISDYRNRFAFQNVVFCSDDNTMDTVKKTCNTKCNIPSSEPLRISVKQTNMTTIYV